MADVSKHKIAFYLSVFIILFIGYNVRFYLTGQVIAGDGIEYFMYLPSIVFDQDLVFYNQIRQIHDMDPSLYTKYSFRGYEVPAIRSKEPSLAKEKTKLDRFLGEGYVGFAHHSIGCMILWMPAYLLSIPLAYLFNFPVDGVNPFHQYVTFLSTLVYAVFGLYIYELLACRLGFKTKHVYFSILAVVFGSFLMQYFMVEPSQSHALDFFLSMVYYLLLFNVVDSGDRKYAALLGAVAGLSTAVRPQNILLLLPSLIALFYSNRDVKVLLGKSAYFTVFFLIFSSPLFISLKVMYGSYWIPDEEDVFRFEYNPKVLDVLFSTRHSLFVTTPILFFGFIGFLIYLRGVIGQPGSRRVFLLMILLVFLTQLYFNSAIADWWAGCASGARRFSSIMVLFMLGLSHIRDRYWNRLSQGVVLAVVAYNLVYHAVFNLNMVDPYRAVSYQDTLKAFWRLLKALLS